MFKLESNRLKREFKITNGNFYASQILNKCSGMSFVPDGNGCEFVVFFTDGTEVSSKGLPVMQSSEENNKLKFVFAEDLGCTVTLEYWVHDDGNTICKQITVSQNNSKVIDRIFLDNIGIINSVTHFGIDPNTHREGADYVTSLGQPFYIDSLFFGCDSPAVDSKIIHGAGQIRYYIGKNVGKDFKCPVTFMGGGTDNTMQAMQKAFFEYLDSFSVAAPLRFNFACGYFGRGGKHIAAEDIAASAKGALQKLNVPDMPEITDFELLNTDWIAEKGEFWEFGRQWQNGFDEIKSVCESENKGLGITFDLSGNKKLAKKIQKAGNGFVHDEAEGLCLASARYNEKITEYIVGLIRRYNLGCVVLDFGKSENIVCKNDSHDHGVGGKNDMYYINDLTENRMEMLRRIRAISPEIYIILRGVSNVSPLWKQWANVIDNRALSTGEGSIIDDEMPKLEAALTESDTVYYDTMCSHAVQLPAEALQITVPEPYNLSNDEFQKYVMWSVVRGEGLVNLTAFANDLDSTKHDVLAKALKFKRENQHILKNCTVLGGRPADGNIYGFVAWCEDGEGVIAMRNPTDEKASLTLTLNKLMGVPESLTDARRENVYSVSILETSDTFSYGSKINITLHPFESVIFRFTK